MADAPVKVKIVAALPVSTITPLVRVIANVEAPVDENAAAVSVLAPSASVPCVNVAVRVEPNVRLSPSVTVMPDESIMIGKSSVLPFVVIVPVLKKVTAFAPPPTVIPAGMVSAPTEMATFVQVPVNPVKSIAKNWLVAVSVMVSEPAVTFNVFAISAFPVVTVRVPVDPA